ncbi:MAG: metallophosphoesterase [Chloroflexi bacterium]|nr:metallophosphoesterase [Chloroflexota bacterium]
MCSCGITGLVVACTAFLAESAIFGPRRLTRVHMQLDTPLPEGLQALTILHLSDFHFVPRDRWMPKILQQVVRETQALPPDVIAITGDFVEWDDDIEQVAGLISGLQARYGIFAVLGNHDYGNRCDPHEVRQIKMINDVIDALLLPFTAWRARPAKPCGNDADRIVRVLTDFGIVVLRNEAVPVHTPRGTFWIAGVDEPHQRRSDLQMAVHRIPDTDSYLLLAHSPEVLEAAPVSHTPFLTLAGHTHGGQILLPGLKPLVTHTRVPLPRYSGLLSTELGPLYISRGLGGTVSLRFRCPPEITALTLVESPAAQQVAPNANDSLLPVTA